MEPRKMPNPSKGICSSHARVFGMKHANIIKITRKTLLASIFLVLFKKIRRKSDKNKYLCVVCFDGVICECKLTLILKYFSISPEISS